jgi:hypothetical protein
MRLLIVCFNCQSQEGCVVDKIGGQRRLCESCLEWDSCWQDNVPAGTKIPETSTFCPKCVLQRNKEKKNGNKKGLSS